jgi:hypothetical protein
MRGAIPPFLQYTFMARYSVKKKQRNNFTFMNLRGKGWEDVDWISFSRKILLSGVSE